MRTLHLMTYNKPEFANAIKEFLKEINETNQKLTFGLKMTSDLLPKYSKRQHVRPLDLKTRTQESYSFDKLQGDENFLSLSELRTNEFLKVGEQIISDG